MNLARTAASLLRWPTFLYAFFLLTWSVALGTITYQVKLLNLRKKRNDVLGWEKGMKMFFQYTVLQVGDQQLYRDDCMYLCNHRSWADFLVDQYVTEGRSMFMSRWAVFFVFPAFMFAINAIRAVLLFKRTTVKDKEAFNNWIDTQMAASPQTALAVYPEGHRNTRRDPLPLKTGMLKYAYSRKLPVQIVIGANKESILSEKHKTARLGQTVAVGFSEVVLPQEYPTFEVFMEKIQTTWDAHWRKVFSADFSKLSVLPDVEEPQFDYPMSLRLKMLWIAPLTVAVFLATVYYSLVAAGKVLALFGPLQTPVLIVLLAYVAASFWVYSRPVDALTLHESMMKQSKQSTATLQGAPSNGYLIASGIEDKTD